MILDEPTVGLDPIQIREIRGLIRDLGNDHGVILSTHILSEVQTVCDRVQIINKGSLVLDDDIEGLARYMKSRTLTVAFQQPPDAALLRGLPGVRALEHTQDRHVRLFCDPDHDPTEAIIRLALEQNWGLREIAPERASLEQIFVELTTDEHSAEHPGPTAEAAQP